MKTRLTPVLSPIVAGMLLAIPPVYSELVFSEDFEAYAPGSDLNGQGGWSGGNGTGSPSSSGLSGAPPMHAQLDASHPNSWQTITNTGTADIQFDLGAVVRLNHLHLWNLNFYPPYNGRGARQVRISTSLDASAWTVAVPQAEFPVATGADGDPGFALCATEWPEGRYVRFEVLSNWGGSDNAGHTGLSEVRFVAINPLASPFSITHFERLPQSNEVVLGFPASVELRYTIEWSEDLVSWYEAMIVEVPASSPDWRVTLPGQALEAARHFRVRACLAATH